MAAAGRTGGRGGPRRPEELYLRTDDEFVHCALNLARPELAAVRRALGRGQADGAWGALLAHFARRRRPCDPVVVRWRNSAANANRVRRAMAAAGDNLSAWRKGGRVDWTCGNAPRRCDWEKYWSRNGLGFLCEWAAAAEASGRAELRAAVARSFLEWYRDCPVPSLPHGGYWVQEVHGFAWREIEVAVRGRHFISLFLTAVRWPDAPREFLRALLVSIRQHLDYLRTYYAAFGFIEGNHQNHHAQAPLAAGVLLPELEGAPGWLALGLRIYREHLASDFDADRVQNEYSPAYHGNMLRIYLDAYEVLKSNRRPLPGWLEKSVRAMSEYMLHATGPDGWQVPINDSRPGRSEAIRAWAAGLLRMPELLALEGGPGRRPPTDRAYFPAGLAFMRSGWEDGAAYVVLDATKPSLPRCCGHWHPGKPNLLIQAGSQPLACEHLFASYDDPSFWEYFHTGRAHNTVLVDGRGDGVPELPWRWRYVHRSCPELDFFASSGSAAVARATTDGFRRMKPPVDFVRTVVFVKPDLVLVHDVIDSRGEHVYEWLLHFLPGALRPDRRSRSLMTALGGEAELLCRPVGTDLAGLAGPALRTGWTSNSTAGVPSAGREYWRPPARGRSAALLAPAPYAVWKRVGRRVVFDFVLQIVRPGDEPVAIEAPDDGLPAGTTACRLNGGRGAVVAVFDDRPGRGRPPLHTGGLLLRGRVGVSVGAGRRQVLLSDGRLSVERRAPAPSPGRTR